MGGSELVFPRKAVWSWLQGREAALPMGQQHMPEHL